MNNEIMRYNLHTSGWGNKINPYLRGRIGCRSIGRVIRWEV